MSAAPARPFVAVPVRQHAPPVSGYVGWWDAADIASITITSGKVSQWNDKGSGGHNLSQATAGKRPTSGANLIGGLNVLTFDGAATYLSGTTPLAAILSTVFVVAQNTDAGATQRDVFQFGEGTGDGRIYRTSADHIDMFNGLSIDSGQTWGTTLAHVVAATFNGASSKLTVDGGAVTNGTVNTNAPGSTWEAGAFNNSEWWKGYIGEIIVYSSALSNANRKLVEDYLLAKWSI